MIAWAGAERLALGLCDTLDTAPRPRWPLDDVRGPPSAVDELLASKALAGEPVVGEPASSEPASPPAPGAAAPNAPEPA